MQTGSGRSFFIRLTAVRVFRCLNTVWMRIIKVHTEDVPGLPGLMSSRSVCVKDEAPADPVASCCPPGELL